jgi:hypothetical protein
MAVLHRGLTPHKIHAHIARTPPGVGLASPLMVNSIPHPMIAGRCIASWYLMDNLGSPISRRHCLHRSVLCDLRLLRARHALISSSSRRVRCGRMQLSYVRNSVTLVEGSHRRIDRIFWMATVTSGGHRISLRETGWLQPSSQRIVLLALIFAIAYTAFTALQLQVADNFYEIGCLSFGAWCRYVRYVVEDHFFSGLLLTTQQRDLVRQSPINTIYRA